VLERTGATLTRAADARPGDRLRTHLAQGELKSRVVEKGEAGLVGGPARCAPESKSGLILPEEPTASRAKHRGGRAKDDQGPTLFEEEG
jgi:hypothetical protein